MINLEDIAKDLAVAYSVKNGNTPEEIANIYKDSVNVFVNELQKNELPEEPLMKTVRLR